jgi:hypothetical protein
MFLLVSESVESRVRVPGRRLLNHDCIVLDESNQVETSSLKGIEKLCKGSNAKCPAPEGAFDLEELAVSLKRYPDTNPEFSSRLQKKTDWVEITTES